MMLLIAFLGGIVTVLSPCILPVIPFLFARADRSFRSVALTLVGLTLTFAVVSTLAVASSGWIIQASAVGRHLALVVLALFALSMLSSRVGAWLTRPFVALGNRLDQSGRAMSGSAASVMLGVATGLLWAPCAGPILGLILTSAMLQGANVNTSVLLLVYGSGAALALGTLIFAGNRLLNRLKRSLAVTHWFRRGAGALMLAAVAVIASGVDEKLLTGFSSNGASQVESGILDLLPDAASSITDGLIGKANAEPLLDLKREGPMPSLSGAVQWLNSEPLTRESLHGKVVLVDFWAFDCINCKRSMPHVNEWAKKYAKDGLVVIGVHTPEYGFEKVIDSVRAEVDKRDVHYPVAIDNDYRIWTAFQNRYWPAHYFIDAQGQIRFTHFGEGRYEHQEKVIQQLLKEAKDTSTAIAQ